MMMMRSSAQNTLPRRFHDAADPDSFRNLSSCQTTCVSSDCTL